MTGVQTCALPICFPVTILLSYLNLSIREWTCKNGHVLDRDLNAAKNILKEGLKIISSGTGDYTDGDGVRSSNTQLSTKSEAHPISLAVGG